MGLELGGDGLEQLLDVDGLGDVGVHARVLCLDLVLVEGVGRKAALEAGMNDHLPKPFLIEDLFAMMRRYL